MVAITSLFVSYYMLIFLFYVSQYTNVIVIKGMGIWRISFFLWGEGGGGGELSSSNVKGQILFVTLSLKISKLKNILLYNIKIP